MAATVAIGCLLVAWALYLWRSLGRLDYRRYPVESYALIALALTLAVVARGAALWMVAIAGGLFVYWTASYSNLPRKAPALRVGEPAPEFELPDARGETVRLSDFRSRCNVLLIFYRGHW